MTDERRAGGSSHETPTLMAPGRVGKLDADFLRASVASKLFGSAAEPAKIGHFTVLKRLGSGGMGVVYSAYDDQLDRKVAIKLLRTEGEGTRGQGLQERLTREAQALAQLSHPNVIQVYEVGTFRGQVYVAMEFVDGCSLAEYEAEDQDDALAKLIAAGRGLVAAHAAGLIHRDFKPDNVMVGVDGRVRVLDFGLARASVDDALDDALHELDAGTEEGGQRGGLAVALTQTGAVMGTPAYMAPEQFVRSKVDGRSDQFSFCVAAWEVLYGTRPFQGDTLHGLATNVIEGRISEPARGAPRVAARIRRALRKGLSRQPENRFHNMEALLAELEPRRPVWALVLAGGLIVVVAVLGALLAWGRAPDDPCAGGEAELEGVWDDAVKAKVRVAFESTEASFAADAYVGTERLLDVYAEQWGQMHRQACEASVVRKEESPELFGRRMVCLGQRLSAVAELSELLSQADTRMVTRAVVAAGSLPELTDCGDADVLMAQSFPVDEAHRNRLAELDRMLAQGNAQLVLGEYDAGLRTSIASLEEARALGAADREGQALLLQGELLAKQASDFDHAEEVLRQALRVADSAHDDGTRVRAWIRLVQVVGYREHEFEEAAALARDAQAGLRRIGNPPVLLASLHTQLGSVADARGDFDEAIAQHQQALEIRRDHHGPKHTEVGTSLNNLGNANIHAERLIEADAHLSDALEIFEQNLGPNHPYLGIASSNLGHARVNRAAQLGDDEERRRLLSEAEAAFERALAIQARNGGSSSLSHGKALTGLGEVQLELGRPREALETFSRALAIKEAAMGRDHPNLVLPLIGVGRALVALERRREAEAELRRAMLLFDEGSPDEDRADAERTLAIAIAPHAPKEAREMAERALSRYRDAGEPHARDAAELAAWMETALLSPADE